MRQGCGARSGSGPASRAGGGLLSRNLSARIGAQSRNPTLRITGGGGFSDSVRGQPSACLQARVKRRLHGGRARVGRTQRGNVEVADQLFVSYSHADAALIDPILKLLRFGNRVFSDHEIEPGQRWREAIERAITESSSVVVLWCCHSAVSQEVEHEITFAVASAKPLVPILLCPAPVGSALNEFQWIDASSIMKHMCRCVDVGTPPGPVTWRRRTPETVHSPRRASAFFSFALRWNVPRNPVGLFPPVRRASPEARSLTLSRNS